MVCIMLPARSLKPLLFVLFPFNMMLICDANNASKDFLDLSDELEALGREIGCIIKLQREEIFESMQRI